MKFKNLFFREETRMEINPKYISYYKTPDEPTLVEWKFWEMRPWLDSLLEFFFVGLGVLLGGVVLVVFLWWGVGGSIRTYAHSQDKQACQVFGQQTGHETKFVDYTFWSWSCLTPGFNGKWVSTSNPSLYQPKTQNLNLNTVKP